MQQAISIGNAEMPKVEIEQRTFERLQSHAEPLVDTLDSVINLAVDALERDETSQTDRTSRPPPSTTSDGLMSLAPDDPLPDLKHTRVLSVAIAGNPVVRANWNNVLQHLLELAVDAGHSPDEIRRLCAVNLVAGEKDDEGYRHLAEAGISYQGLNANAAAAATAALAKRLGVALELEFEWRGKPDALHPGRRGQLRLPGR